MHCIKVDVCGVLQVYNEMQIKQLTRLIEVTRTELPKADRQKVMNMITIDAHSRDIVENINTSGTSRYMDPLLRMPSQALPSYLSSACLDVRHPSTRCITEGSCTLGHWSIGHV